MAASNVLNEVSAHLENVDEDSTTPLDVDLLEKAELFTNTPDYRQTWSLYRPLFLQIATLLPKLQQDPSPLTHFITKLATPYSFEDIKDVEFEIGLQLEAAPFHSLILSLLEKASAAPNDAQALANRPGVMFCLVRLWLCTQDAGIATQAANLLTSLLRTSWNEPGPTQGEQIETVHYGNGPMWKRLFNDRDIYALYYQYTSLKDLSSPVEPVLSKREKTLAQARLLDWLPQVGSLDWSTLVTGHGIDVEREAGLSKGQGLLHYASLKMVDSADDILMHMTLINFFSDLITKVKTSPHLTHYDSSLSLDFVKEQGIHKDIIDFHTSESPGLEHSFLSSRTAHYIAEYASNYPDNFENSSELQTIRQYVHRNIRKCEANDLTIVAAMPRAALIPRKSSGLAWDECVILDIPIKRTNPDALKTLATVFHGPGKPEVTFPPRKITNAASNRHVESTFARLLISLYYTKNPTLFSDIVTHADTVAMKDNALAALTVLSAIVTANWDFDTRPDQIPESDPIYLRLHQFPKTAVDLILDPTISGGVLPYLMKPATTFSNLVGGRGDAENAAYQVAMAKFDVLQALGRRLESEGGRQDVTAMVRRRVSEGPWGVGGSAGSRIGTLEL